VGTGFPSGTAVEEEQFQQKWAPVFRPEPRWKKEQFQEPIFRPELRTRKSDGIE